MTGCFTESHKVETRPIRSLTEDERSFVENGIESNTGAKVNVFGFGSGGSPNIYWPGQILDGQVLEHAVMRSESVVNVNLKNVRNADEYADVAADDRKLRRSEAYRMLQSSYAPDTIIQHTLKATVVDANNQPVPGYEPFSYEDCPLTLKKSVSYDLGHGASVSSVGALANDPRNMAFQDPNSNRFGGWRKAEKQIFELASEVANKGLFVVQEASIHFWVT